MSILLFIFALKYLLKFDAKIRQYFRIKQIFSSKNTNLTFDMVERIKQIIEYYKLNPYAFSQKISVSEGTIRKYLGGKIGMKVETLAKILVTFDEVNPDWLLLGNGEMLRRNAQKKEGVDLLNMVSLEKYEEKVEECALLKAELNALKEAASNYADREKEHSYIGSLEEARM